MAGQMRWPSLLVCGRFRRRGWVRWSLERFALMKAMMKQVRSFAEDQLSSKKVRARGAACWCPPRGDRQAHRGEARP